MSGRRSVGLNFRKAGRSNDFGVQSGRYAKIRYIWPSRVCRMKWYSPVRVPYLRS